MERQVLVVEDDDTLRAFIVRTLEAAGHAVTEAVDGEEALREAPSADLILLNLGLPKVSGLEVLKALRAARDYVPVIVVSGDPDGRHKATEYRIVDFVEKPFSARDLMERVEKALRIAENMDSIPGMTQRIRALNERNQ